MERDGHCVRFYPTSLLGEDRTLISILRQPRQRSIVTYLILHPGSDYKALMRELKLSSSTVSWYLNRLERSGIITRENTIARSLCFKLVEPERLAKILSTYSQSFLDKAVDSFLATWENL